MTHPREIPTKLTVQSGHKVEPVGGGCSKNPNVGCMVYLLNDTCFLKCFRINILINEEVHNGGTPYLTKGW